MKHFSTVAAIVFLALTQLLAAKKPTEQNNPNNPQEKATCYGGFRAAERYVTINYTETCNADSLTGTGSVSFMGESVAISFENIKIGVEGAQYYLQKGTVYGDIIDRSPIKLNPEKSENSFAYFYPDSIKLNRYNYNVKGVVKSKIASPINALDSIELISKTSWFLHERNFLLGPAVFSENCEIKINSEGSNKVIFPDSKFYIRGNLNYLLQLKPKLVSNIDTLELDDTGYDSYFTASNLRSDSNNFGIRNIEKYTLDLSDKQSPSDTNLTWKGIHKKNISFTLNERIINRKMEDYTIIVDSSIFSDFCDSDTVSYPKVFDQPDSIYFSGFEGGIDSLYISIPNTKNGSYIKGTIKIPYLEGDHKYPFTFHSADSFKLDTALKDVILPKNLHYVELKMLGLFINDSIWKYTKKGSTFYLQLPDTIEKKQYTVYYIIDGINIFNDDSQEVLVRNTSTFDLSSSLTHSIEVKNLKYSKKIYTKVSFYTPSPTSDISLVKSLSIYPTNVGKYINIKNTNSNPISNDYNIQIINLLGQVVYSEKHSTIPDRILVAYLEPGLYNLRITSSKSVTFSSKFIKK